LAQIVAISDKQLLLRGFKLSFKRPCNNLLDLFHLLSTWLKLLWIFLTLSFQEVKCLLKGICTFLLIIRIVEEHAAINFRNLSDDRKGLYKFLDIIF